MEKINIEKYCQNIQIEKIVGKVRLSSVKYYKIEIFWYVFTYKYGQ